MRLHRHLLLALLGLTCAAAGCRRGSLDPDGGGSGMIVGAAGARGTAGAVGTAGDAGAPGNVGTAGGSAATGTGGGSGQSETGPESCSYAGITQVRPPNCAAALCGNGVLDWCDWSSVCGTASIREYCDGTNVGGASCTSMGYPSGTVACRADCTLDWTQCSECVPPAAGGLAQCADAPIGGNAAIVRMAATDREIGLLWLTPGDGSRLTTLDFARLAPDLTLLSTTRLETGGLYAAPGTRKAFGVAPSPSGWIVAGWGDAGIFIHAIDAAGTDLGRTVLTGFAGGGSLAEGPLLVVRPDGPPLVAFVNQLFSTTDTWGELDVAAVGADGLSFGPAQRLSQDDWLRPHGLTFAGDAFQAAVVTADGSIRVQRIETDGTPTTVVDALPGTRATSVAPVACNGGLCLVYGGILPAPYHDGAGYMWQQIDATGAGGNTVGFLAFDSVHDYQWAASLALGGSETVTVLGGASDNSLGVTHTSSLGAPLTFDTPIARWPDARTSELGIALRGRDLLVAWGSPLRNRIRIARVSF